MKLNTKRTLLIGLAFFSICAFWQMYDTIIPLILRDTFHIGDSVSGWIMAADNVLALFLLPLFGRLSDRANTRLGKRMPFIAGGTAAAVALTLVLSAADAPGRRRREAEREAKEQEAAERRARADQLREEAAERARRNDSVAGRIKNTAISTATRQVVSNLTKGISKALGDLFGGKKR